MRRTAAVLIGIAFAIVLSLALFLLRVEQTFLSASFYTDQLQKRGAYEFLMVDLLGSATRELLASPTDTLGSGNPDTLLRDSGLTADQIVAAVHQGLSPDQLRELVEPSIFEFVRYATAESDQVRIRVDAAGQAHGLLGGVLALLRQSGFYQWFIDTEILPAVREFSETALPVEPDLVVKIAGHVVTADWLAGTVEEVADPVVAYLFADADEFAIRVRISDTQAEAVSGEIESALLGGVGLNLIRTYVLAPAIAENLGSPGELPLGIELSAERVAATALGGAPSNAIEPQVSAFADDFGSYVLGRSQRFNSHFDLASARESVDSRARALARENILLQLDQLPVCVGRPEQPAPAAATAGPELPECKPSDVTAEELLVRDYAEIESSIAREIRGAIPDRVTFTESDLRDAIGDEDGGGALASLDDWRGLVGDGFEYSDSDMRRDLAETGDLEALDDFRSFFANGLVLSASDTPPEGFAAAISAELTPVRELATEIRRSAWIAAALAAFLLLIAGLLADNAGSGRLLWASAVLLASSVTLLLFYWPGFEAGASALQELARAEIDQPDPGDFGATATLVSDYAIDSIKAVATDFLNGIRIALAVLAALGIAGIVGARDWQRRRTIAT